MDHQDMYAANNSTFYRSDQEVFQQHQAHNRMLFQSNGNAPNPYGSAFDQHMHQMAMAGPPARPHSQVAPMDPYAHRSNYTHNARAISSQQPTPPPHHVPLHHHHHHHHHPHAHGEHESQLPTQADFDNLLNEYILSLSPKKRDKALIPEKRYNNILAVLKEPKCTTIESAQFRFWAKKMFRLGVVGDHQVVLHEGKPVAVRESLYEVLTSSHVQAQHGGRDKTSAQVRKYFSWVPKELIARFVRNCPSCSARRSQPLDFAGTRPPSHHQTGAFVPAPPTPTTTYSTAASTPSPQLSVPPMTTTPPTTPPDFNNQMYNASYQTQYHQPAVSAADEGVLYSTPY